MKVYKKNILGLLIIFIFYQNSQITYAKQNYFKQIDNAEILQQQNINIYFGCPTCIFCEEFASILRNIVDEHKIFVFNFNIDEWSDNENFTSIVQKYEIDSVPNLVKVRNGKVMEYIDFDVIGQSIYIENEIKSLFYNEINNTFVMDNI